MLLPRRSWLPSVPVFAVALCLLLWALSYVARPALAQEPPAPDAGQAQTAGGAGSERGSGVMQMLKDGGTIGFIIIILSVVALALIIEHFITIRKQRLLPAYAMEELDAKIRARKVDDAIRFCAEPVNDSLLCNVVLAGLQRYKSSEYGFAEYRAAVEEAGEEQTSKLYRKTEPLAVIGAIAPMLGLLGTVQGMIEAFDTIAATGGRATPADLAGSISKALVTTLEGLIVAIPALSALSFFRSRIDSLVAEAGKRVEQIMLPLGRQR
jgi:biopolymer transport protein ExbB